RERELVRIVVVALAARVAQDALDDRHGREHLRDAEEVLVGIARLVERGVVRGAHAVVRLSVARGERGELLVEIPARLEPERMRDVILLLGMRARGGEGEVAEAAP